MTIRCSEREIDGETVGVYSGSFSQTMRGARNAAVDIYTEAYGHFTGVIPPEYRSCYTQED